MHPPWRRRWEISSKHQYVYPTRCKQNGSLSTEQTQAGFSFFYICFIFDFPLIIHQKFFPQLRNSRIFPMMLTAEGTTRLLVVTGLTATMRGQQEEADRDNKVLARHAPNHFQLSGHIWNSTNVPTGLIFTIEISLQQLSAPTAAILTPVIYHNSFH